MTERPQPVSVFERQAMSRRQALFVMRNLAISGVLAFIPGSIGLQEPARVLETLKKSGRVLPPNIPKVVPSVTTGPQRIIVDNTPGPSVNQAQATSGSRVDQRPASTTTATEVLLDPTKWKEWPVVPESINPKLIDLYTQGVLGGVNNPHAFSKAGDCENIPTNGYLFGQFDKGGFKLGKHDDLEPVINWFKGSWSRFPPTVHGGQNAAGILVQNPIMRYDDNHQKDCPDNQTYLECEVMQMQPSLLLISYEQELETLGDYKDFLNMVVSYALDRNIIPIVATCANSEGINSKVAEVASENKIPMWNFWRAVQPLKTIFDPGLNDGFHLSYEGVTESFDFTDSHPTAWNVRNLTGVQVIKSVLEMVNPDFRVYEKNSGI